MKSWEDFHPRVMPYVIGCPVPMVNQALIDASREFCVTTKAWRTTESFPAFTGFDAYDFDKPFASEVVQVLRASVDGKPLKLKNVGALPRYDNEVSERDAALYRVNDEQYRILPQPGAGQTVSITLALRPTESGTGVGDEVFSKFAATIAAGARAILQRMPRREWTDLAQAQIDAMRFVSDMNRAAEYDEFMQLAPSERRVKAWG